MGNTEAKREELLIYAVIALVSLPVVIASVCGDGPFAVGPTICLLLLFAAMRGLVAATGLDHRRRDLPPARVFEGKPAGRRARSTPEGSAQVDRKPAGRRARSTPEGSAQVDDRRR